jgi:hypothetical protein
MDENVDEALFSGYEHLIGELTLPDPKDHHVLAAAIHGAEIERRQTSWLTPQSPWSARYVGPCRNRTNHD